MKRALQVLALSNIILLYCFTLSIYSHGYIKHIPYAQSQSDKDNNLSFAASDNFFCHTLQSRNNVNEINNLPSSVQKDWPNSLTNYFRALDKIYLNIFSKYIFFFNKIIIGFDSTCITYPFHYFW